MIKHENECAGGAVSDTAAKPAADPARQLHRLFTTENLDAAMDAAGKQAAAIIAEFVAVTITCPGESVTASRIEAAVEFFVPPPDRNAFVAAVELHLHRFSAGYAAGRRAGRIDSPLIHWLPPGTFHQWRCSCRRSPVRTESRWSSSRELIELILHQSEIGWRELQFAD